MGNSFKKRIRIIIRTRKMNKLWNDIIVLTFLKNVQMIEKFSIFMPEFRETVEKR